jgi:hypothetical protein
VTAQAPLSAICKHCKHFNSSGSELEAQLPGLRTLSSAHAAVRSDDGLCGVHERYVASYYTCTAFEAAQSREAKR